MTHYGTLTGNEDVDERLILSLNYQHAQSICNTNYMLHGS